MKCRFQVLFIALLCHFVVDENNFVLKDTRTEEEFDFKLSESLCRARQKPLFEVSLDVVNSDEFQHLCSQGYSTDISDTVDVAVSFQVKTI